jgi:hypothetical protein
MYIIPKRKKSKPGFPKHPRNMRNYHVTNSKPICMVISREKEREEEEEEEEEEGVLCNEIESKDILLLGLIRCGEKATQVVKRAWQLQI